MKMNCRKNWRKGEELRRIRNGKESKIAQKLIRN